MFGILAHSVGGKREDAGDPDLELLVDMSELFSTSRQEHF